jgi:predicted phosphodiesterase
MKKVDAIFCGDNHIREKVPVARTDDFEAEQWRKLTFISDLQKKYNCPVLCSGDFFHHWKPSPELITKVMQYIPNQFYTIYGDHDLPQHSFDLRHKSGLTTLIESGKVHLLNGGHGFDKDSSKISKDSKPSKIGDRSVFVWHVLTWKDELPFPDCKNKSAKKLLKKYPQFDCIVTGDNHIPFVEKYKGRILVNVGSMMRNNADQIDYKPAVWLYSAKNNTVKPVYIPISQGVISREHIEVKAERNARIDAFISKVNTDFKATMSFSENIKRFFSVNKTSKKVKEIIYKNMEDE